MSVCLKGLGYLQTNIHKSEASKKRVKIKPFNCLAIKNITIYVTYFANSKANQNL